MCSHSNNLKQTKSTKQTQPFKLLRISGSSVVYQNIAFIKKSKFNFQQYLQHMPYSQCLQLFCCLWHYLFSNHCQNSQIQHPAVTKIADLLGWNYASLLYLLENVWAAPVHGSVHPVMAAESNHFSLNSWSTVLS